MDFFELRNVVVIQQAPQDDAPDPDDWRAHGIAHRDPTKPVKSETTSYVF